MLFSQKNLNIAFKVLAVGALCAAIYHAVGIFYPINEAPPWRHGLFVVINLLGAWFLLKRPVACLPIFALIMLQQLYSHGTFLINTWNEAHRIDWPSVFVLIFFPLTAVLLWIDYRNKNKY
ncbi:MAG: hypothetical protein U0V74_06940 [Chitinophagales bacterium]